MRTLCITWIALAITVIYTEAALLSSRELLSDTGELVPVGLSPVARSVDVLEPLVITLGSSLELAHSLSKCLFDATTKALNDAAGLFTKLVSRTIDAATLALVHVSECFRSVEGAISGVLYLILRVFCGILGADGS